MLRFQFFPRSHGITTSIKEVIDCFKEVENEINSDDYQYKSNQVLEILRPGLEKIKFDVENREVKK